MSVAIVDMQHADADAAFVSALGNTGFAVLRNPPLNSERLQKLVLGWRAFFCGEDKWNYPLTETPSGNSSGYIPPDVSETAVGHDKKDLKEFFHIVPETQLPRDLAADTRLHLEDSFILGQQLLGWLDKHCADVLPSGLRGKLASNLSPADSLLRVLHYPPLSGSEPAGAVRAAAHEDINLLTILPVSAEPGLQILTRKGGWKDVPGEPGDVIINSGDMLQEASAGAFPSTSHRVINPPTLESNLSRIAIPYFMAPYLNVRLSERYTAGSYLHERLTLLAR
ncbi:MAG: 2OG-Fe(II) oxygenase family protein [Congregibacter sp.]